MRQPALAVALLALAGCAGPDAAELSTFSPLGGDAFEYRATTTFFYGPAADGWAEGQRLDWLETSLDRNAMCPAGYNLTSRRVMARYQSPLGNPVADIVYRGNCRS